MENSFECKSKVRWCLSSLTLNTPPHGLNSYLVSFRIVKYCLDLSSESLTSTFLSSAGQLKSNQNQILDRSPRLNWKSFNLTNDENIIFEILVFIVFAVFVFACVVFVVFFFVVIVCDVEDPLMPNLSVKDILEYFNF